MRREPTPEGFAVCVGARTWTFRSNDRVVHSGITWREFEQVNRIEFAGVPLP